jgi:hypothetical protein
MRTLIDAYRLSLLEGLHGAIRAGDVMGVRAALAKGQSWAARDEDGWDALGVAVRFAPAPQAAAVVQMLLAAGVPAQGASGLRGRRRVPSPLSGAIEREHWAVAELLAAAGGRFKTGENEARALWSRQRIRAHAERLPLPVPRPRQALCRG